MRRTMMLVMWVMLVSASAFAGDWPQWHGPNRDGTVLDSPPLVEEFPKEGPKKLWESEAIPGGEYNGGYAQPVVAEGKVFVFVHNRFQVPIAQRLLTKGALTQLGWEAGMPEDLVKAVEEARTSEARAKLKDYNEINKWADAWIKENEKPDWRKFRYPVKQRLLAGQSALAPEVCRKLEAIVDKEFASQTELDAWMKPHGFDDDAVKAILKKVPTTERDATDLLYCLDSATGKTLWKKEMPGNRWTYATGTSTPAVSAGRCYFLSSSAVAFCLNAADGNVIWESKPLWGTGNIGCTASSILLVKGKAIVGTNAGFHALDAGTGEVLWKATDEKDRPLAANNVSSASVWNAGGKPYLLATSYVQAGKLYCLDLETGKTVWDVPVGISGCTPAVSADTMVFCSFAPEIGLTAYKLSNREPTKLWSVPFKDGFACPVIYKGHVYVIGGANATYGDSGKGHALCIELATGRTVWDETVGPAELSSPLVADGKLIAQVGPWVYLIKASPEKYQLLGKLDLHDYQGRWMSPVLSDGRLFVRTGKNVVCYDLRKQ